MDLPHEERLSKVEERSKSNTHRIEDLEKNYDGLNKLATAVAILAEQVKNLCSDMKEVKSDVSTILKKPGKRWNDLIDKAIWAVAGAGILFMLKKIGL